MPQNIAKSMAFIAYKSYIVWGDLKQGTVVACTSQPVEFNGYPNTHGHLTGFKIRHSRRLISSFLAVVLWYLGSLLME